MQFTNIVQALCLLGATPALVSAANCNPGGNNWEVSTAQYQQAASAICNGGTNVETFFGSVGGGTGKYVSSWFKGSQGSRSQCRNAFDNIISQCTISQRRDGGWWDWSYKGDEQHYGLQSYYRRM